MDFVKSFIFMNLILPPEFFQMALTLAWRSAIEPDWNEVFFANNYRLCHRWRQCQNDMFLVNLLLSENTLVVLALLRVLVS